MKKRLSVVVSCYNEEQGLEQFYSTTAAVLEKCPWDYEIIFVNDGSTDGSAGVFRKFAENDQRVKVISLSRNFGHEAAMIAGIDHAAEDGVVCMDTDLQHPPACIPDMLRALDAGYDVVPWSAQTAMTRGF